MEIDVWYQQCVFKSVVPGFFHFLVIEGFLCVFGGRWTSPFILP